MANTAPPTHLALQSVKVNENLAKYPQTNYSIPASDADFASSRDSLRERAAGITSTSTVKSNQKITFMIPPMARCIVPDETVLRIKCKINNFGPHTRIGGSIQRAFTTYSLQDGRGTNYEHMRHFNRITDMLIQKHIERRVQYAIMGPEGIYEYEQPYYPAEVYHSRMTDLSDAFVPVDTEDDGTGASQSLLKTMDVYGATNQEFKTGNAYNHDICAMVEPGDLLEADGIERIGSIAATSFRGGQKCGFKAVIQDESVQLFSEVRNAQHATLDSKMVTQAWEAGSTIAFGMNRQLQGLLNPYGTYSWQPLVGIGTGDAGQNVVLFVNTGQVAVGDVLRISSPFAQGVNNNLATLPGQFQKPHYGVVTAFNPGVSITLSNVDGITYFNNPAVGVDCVYNLYRLATDTQSALSTTTVDTEEGSRKQHMLDVQSQWDKAMSRSWKIWKEVAKTPWYRHVYSKSLVHRTDLGAFDSAQEIVFTFQLIASGFFNSSKFIDLEVTKGLKVELTLDSDLITFIDMSKANNTGTMTLNPSLEVTQADIMYTAVTLTPVMQAALQSSFMKRGLNLLLPSFAMDIRNIGSNITISEQFFHSYAMLNRIYHWFQDATTYNNLIGYNSFKPLAARPKRMGWEYNRILVPHWSNDTDLVVNDYYHESRKGQNLLGDRNRFFDTWVDFHGDENDAKGDGGRRGGAMGPYYVTNLEAEPSGFLTGIDTNSVGIKLNVEFEEMSTVNEWGGKKNNQSQDMAIRVDAAIAANNVSKMLMVVFMYFKMITIRFKDPPLVQE